jgi:MFS superfamily sulfate permease-like transporter
MAATAVVSVFDLPVETIDTHFGGIPAALPTFTLPSFGWQAAREL